MLGLSVMMIAFTVLISAAVYWISWDLQPMGTRPAFSAKIWTDCSRIIGGKIRRVRMTENRPLKNDIGSPV